VRLVTAAAFDLNGTAALLHVLGTFLYSTATLFHVIGTFLYSTATCFYIRLCWRRRWWWWNSSCFWATTFCAFFYTAFSWSRCWHGFWSRSCRHFGNFGCDSLFYAGIALALFGCAEFVEASLNFYLDFLHLIGLRWAKESHETEAGQCAHEKQIFFHCLCC
jgi:hypothetical protein